MIGVISDMDAWQLFVNVIQRNGDKCISTTPMHYIYKWFQAAQIHHQDQSKSVYDIIIIRS